MLSAGTVSDVHPIAALTVNGVTATVAGGSFTAAVPITPGNQTLHVVATDELGVASIASRIVFVDGELPFITIQPG